MVSVRNKKEEVAPTYQPELLSGGATEGTTYGGQAAAPSAGRGSRRNFLSLNTERLPPLSALLFEESVGFGPEGNLKKPFRGFTAFESNNFLPKVNVVSEFLVQALDMNPNPPLKRRVPSPNCSIRSEANGDKLPNIECCKCRLRVHCQQVSLPGFTSCPKLICLSCTEKDLAKKKNVVKSSLPDKVAPLPKTSAEMKARVSAHVLGGYLSRVRYTNENETMVVKEYSVRKTKQPIQKLTKIDTDVQIIRSTGANNCLLKRLGKRFPVNRRSSASKADSSASLPVKIPVAPPPMSANKTGARSLRVPSSPDTFTMVRPVHSHNPASASYQAATRGLMFLSSVAIESCPP